MEITTTYAVPSLQPLLLTADANPYSDSAKFNKLQENFAAQFESVFPDRMAPKTVVIVPSLTLDAEILEKVDGVIHYEERMLCLLMLLRMPHTHVVYVTSMPIDPAIVDYYLHLLPGITAYHARQRLTLLCCYDASLRSLTSKILERPRLVKRITGCIPYGHQAHLCCFNVTYEEQQLALQLQLPIYGCNPDLNSLGNKSNGRKIFRSCSIPVPLGFEDLYTEEDVLQALEELKLQAPETQKAVVKLNDGFSGEGNALFSFAGAPEGAGLYAWLQAQLHKRLKPVAPDISARTFLHKMKQGGGIVEAFIEGKEKTSPSVQCRINPLGKIDVISTHDQMLGGASGQVFIGATFPALGDYAAAIGALGHTVAEELHSYGVLGRFSVDFISVKEAGQWKHYAIEINLRKGGTSHPYLMLQMLTDGTYHWEKGEYTTSGNQPRFYICSDNLKSEHYKGLTPHDLIDIAMCNDLLYDGSSQEGTIFHLISALSQYGKLGVVCIGATPQRAQYFFDKTKEVLYKEGRTA